MLSGGFHILLIALVTLPLAGTPLAIWLYIQYRRDAKATAAKLHVVPLS